MNTQSARESNTPPAFGDDALTKAYERRLAEIQAVGDEELTALNLDVRSAVTTVLGALPKIRALREDMAGLRGLDERLVDGLEDYARAAAEASSRHATSLKYKTDIVALNERAVKMRETLRRDASVLVHRGLIDATRLSRFTGRMGYRNVAFELISWANVMRDCWPAIEGKTALTVEEILGAKELGDQLVLAVGRRGREPVETARIRHQALTLLVRAYDEVRSAVAFLRRREGDAESIAPSLYGRRRRRRAEASESEASTASASADVMVPAEAAITTDPTDPSIVPGLPGGTPIRDEQPVAGAIRAIASTFRVPPHEPTAPLRIDDADDVRARASPGW